MIYFKFQVNIDPPKSDNQIDKDSLLVKILRKILPIANPDFESKIPLVTEWLIEYENANHYVNREIGKNKYGEIIVKMPDNRNYGYWSDNNLNFEDFKKHFEIKSLGQKEFIEYWGTN